MGPRMPRPTCQACWCANGLRLLANPLLFLYAILPATSFAQVAPSSAVVEVSPPNGAATTVITTITSSAPTNSATGILSSSSQQTLQSTLSTAVQPGSTPVFEVPAESDPDADSEISHNTTLLNYYFVFLAILGVLLFLGVYLLHRRKKRVKARFRNSGQNALARDLDGWVNTRRWMHGNWRAGHPGTVERQDDGLNELGEAPPPYKPRPDSPPLDDSCSWGAQGGSASSTLTVPLAVLTREGRASQKPPDYVESIRTESPASTTRDNHLRIPSTTMRVDSPQAPRPPIASFSA